MPETIRRNRNLFAATTSGLNIRICEMLADGLFRVMLWSKLTKAERRRGKEFVKQLAPDSEMLVCVGACAWSKPNGAKTAEVAKALEEFIAAMERRHGAEIWVR
jgi:hypothetical protein